MKLNISYKDLKKTESILLFENKVIFYGKKVNDIIFYENKKLLITGLSDIRGVSFDKNNYKEVSGPFKVLGVIKKKKKEKRVINRKRKLVLGAVINERISVINSVFIE